MRSHSVHHSVRPRLRRVLLAVVPHLPALLAALLALAAPLAPDAAPQDLLKTISGPASQSGFGVVAPAGDFDDDGVTDLVIGAPFDDAAGADAGLVRVVSGDSGAVLLTLQGPTAGARFGAAVAGLGDLDADGTPDLLVGAPGTGTAAGLARVHSGATGAVLRTLDGANAGDRFGAAVAGIADLDADGRHDLVIGAPGADGPATDAGAVAVYSGATGALLHFWTGSAAGDQLGASVGGQALGTLFVDSEPDVVIGCTQSGTGGTGAGHVRGYSRDDGSLLYTIAGAASHDAFGTALARVGDVNGDGKGDLLVGSGAGYARLHSGSDGALLGSFAGPAATGFGRAVAGVGDVNGDGVPDFAIGQPGADVHGTDSGSVHLVSGATQDKLHVLQGPGAHAESGAYLSYAGDLDGDTLADVAIGAPGQGVLGLSAGAVFTLSLTRWEDQGGGLPGVHDIPQLEGHGGLVASTEVELSLTGARSLASVTLVLGHSAFIDVGLLTLTPMPDVVVTGLLTSSAGSLDYSFTWPVGVPPATTVYYQFRVQDPVAVGGEALSNTIAAMAP